MESKQQVVWLLRGFIKNPTKTRTILNRHPYEKIWLSFIGLKNYFSNFNLSGYYATSIEPYTGVVFDINLKHRIYSGFNSLCYKEISNEHF